MSAARSDSARPARPAWAAVQILRVTGTPPAENARPCTVAEPRRMERAVQRSARMTLTIGELVSTLFDAYDRELHDERLAAVATQVRIVELMAPRPQRSRADRNAA